MTKAEIILDLCGGSGAWSKPYKDAGYDVRLVTLPEQNVIDYIPPKNVYGILAAPPCTEFAVSGARWWKDKDPNLLVEALRIAYACLDIVDKSNPIFWVLENPVGRLRKYIGPPVMYFQPYEYGDPWTKKTCLWGKFNIPKKNSVKAIGQWMERKGKPGLCDHFKDFLPPDWIHKLPPSKDRAMLRSLTPSGFAKAFFEANP